MSNTGLSYYIEDKRERISCRASSSLPRMPPKRRVAPAQESHSLTRKHIHDATAESHDFESERRRDTSAARAPPCRWARAHAFAAMPSLPRPSFDFPRYIIFRRDARVLVLLRRRRRDMPRAAFRAAVTRHAGRRRGSRFPGRAYFSLRGTLTIAESSFTFESDGGGEMTSSR